MPTFHNSISVPSSKAVCTRPMKMEQSVSKRRHMKFRRRGINKKKIQPTVCTTTQQFIAQLRDCQPLKKNAAAAVPSANQRYRQLASASGPTCVRPWLSRLSSTLSAVLAEVADTEETAADTGRFSDVYGNWPETEREAD
jgi:hypothetical protein